MELKAAAKAKQNGGAKSKKKGKGKDNGVVNHEWRKDEEGQMRYDMGRASLANRDPREVGRTFLRFATPARLSDPERWKRHLSQKCSVRVLVLRD
ncbi:hypothetical protein N9L19_01320 [bacterium]|nr:hypothetical protein [bacterium]